MIRIESMADIDIHRARLPPHLMEYLRRLFTGITKAIPSFNSQNDGYIAVIEKNDNDASVSENLGRKWLEGCFEGVSYCKNARCYSTVILRNNQYAISIVIPDEPWLDRDIRDKLHREMN